MRFAYKVYRRPFRTPVRTSHGAWIARDGVLLRVEDENGRIGHGEVAPLERFGTETLAGAVAWCATVGNRTGLARLRAVPRGLPCCAAAVSAALEESGVSSDAAPRRLDSACLLPTAASARDALSRAVDAGFTTFKLKIGAADFPGERALIARIAGELPAGGRLRLDANGGLDTRTASRWLEAAADWPVEFIEQPLPTSAERDLVRFASDCATTLALDESVRDADDVKRWRDRGWPGVFVIKPALAGAPAELVREIGIEPGQFVFSSALETRIGTAAGVRLAFRAGVTRALGYGVGAFFEDDGLGGGVAHPSLSRDDLAAWNLEAVWNQL